MKIARIEFVVPVHVPGRPQRHNLATADADLTVALEDGFVRMVSGAVTILVPLSNVAWIFPATEEVAPVAPKKRSGK